MDEILELQHQLQAAQQTSSSQKLSERNCIELVMKLQSLNLVDLIFTRSGKEYLTPKHLVIEIEDELLARGGRVNIIDLPDALNVSLNHIEAAMPKIVKEDDSVRLVRGEVLTDYYLEDLAEEVNDSLIASETGTDEVGAIATRYSLPVDIIRETIAKHQGAIIRAKYEASSGLIRSAASLALQESAARGMLRAVSAPTMLSDLASTGGLPQSLVHQVANEMLDDGRLAGRIEGRSSRALLIPKVFIDASVTAVSSAFTANGFVSYGQFRKLYVQDISSFVKEHLSDGVMLQDCVISSVLLETIAASTSEALQQEKWLDVQNALPLDFPESDVPAVVNQVAGNNGCEQPKEEKKKVSRTRKKTKGSNSASNEKQNIIYGERFVVARHLTNMLTDIITNHATKKADDRAKLIAERGDVVVSQGSSKPPEASANQSNKKSKGKGRRRGGTKEDAAPKIPALEDVNTRFPIEVPAEEDIIDLALQDPLYPTTFETDYLESSNDGEVLVQAMVATLFGEDGLKNLYTSKAADAIVNLERERAAAKLKAEKEILSMMERIEMYHKSADTLPGEEIIMQSKASVVSDYCVSCLCQIVDSVARSMGIVFDSLVTIQELSTKREKLDLLRETVTNLPPTVQTNIRGMISVLSDKEGGSAEDFLNLYDGNAVILDLPERRPLDNKRARNAQANSRAELVSMLDSDEVNLSPTRALEVGIVLTHSKISGGAIVAVPKDSIFECSKVIENQANAGDKGIALQKLREAVEAVDVGEVNLADTGTDQYLEPLKELRNVLR
ncbi:E3 UFM1-protein ligase 1 [Gracilaria domingensis]|nr:E3 UFM1-protein ligase 1 [Gracilaria domingensis]